MSRASTPSWVLICSASAVAGSAYAFAGRFVGTPRQSNRSADLAGSLQLGVQSAAQALRQSLDAAAAAEPAADDSVILEEMKDMQVLRITANGRLFRYAQQAARSCSTASIWLQASSRCPAGC